MDPELEAELLEVEDNDVWISDLKAALVAQSDFSTVRNITRGRQFPNDCRAQAWLVLLGVAHKPDPFLDFDQLYDLPEQSLIRIHCQQIVDKLGNESGTDKLAVTSDLESILTLYCKQRRDAESQNESSVVGESTASADHVSVSDIERQNERKTSSLFDPDNGWTDILQLLAALNLSKHQMYNVFYAITTKYVPRGCVPNGRPFDLFRLLLLYHDPQLCSFLDTRKLTPDYYAGSWFNSLFASTGSLDVALAMWDVYLQQADPFLVFFMALVILVNAREQILAMTDDAKEAIADTIRQFPSQLEAPDIADFCQLAMYYSNRTPQSFRRDYHGPLYGSHFMADGFENITVHTLLCLPVSIQELLKSSTSSSPARKKRDALGVDTCEEYDELRFFVVDGRPPKQYNNGHLPGAFSIDASLIVNDPTQFHSLAKTLQEIKARTQLKSHWCLMGSGRDEEDKYVHMVASYLLQRNTPYVSIARGGYQALHEALKETLATRLKSHSVKGCLVCSDIGKPVSDHAAAVETSPKRSLTPKEIITVGNGEKHRASITEKSWSIFSRVKDVVKHKSAEVKDMVLIAAAGPGGEDGGSPVHRHIDSQDRNASGKKPYRNLVNVFSISDDASDDEFGSGAEDENGVDDSDRSASAREKVRLKEWLKRTEIIAYFECQEIDEQSVVHPSHLALTKTHLYVLREIADQAGHAFVKSRRNLSSIQRITSKRQHPEVLTFKYGFELAPDRQKITGAERFWVPKAGDCAKAVKTAIVQLQESIASPMTTGDENRSVGKQAGEAEI